ncbi:MAG: hypothetical protein MJ207_00245 [Bacilli bacterium]|nr:hypothetical protein [Bacilli bacterium]MCQ2793792.1 hypothetical protein [Bacilli bacterium]
MKKKVPDLEPEMTPEEAKRHKRTVNGLFIFCVIIFLAIVIISILLVNGVFD